jgi:hypothetical protein
MRTFEIEAVESSMVPWITFPCAVSSNYKSKCRMARGGVSRADTLSGILEAKT